MGGERMGWEVRGWEVREGKGRRINARLVCSKQYLLVNSGTWLP